MANETQPVHEPLAAPATDAPTGAAPTAPATGPAGPTAKPSMKQRLEQLASQYGPVAITTYLVIFVVVLVGFAVAIRAGVEVEGAAGNASLLGAAWLATKVTQPLRIGATLVLTPIVGGAWQRLRGGGARSGQ